MQVPSLRRSFQGFDRRVWVLFYGRIMTATGFSMVIPFLSMYLHNDLGISMSLVGLLLLFTSLVGSLGNIVGGELCDRLGRKRIMMIGLLWRTASFVIIAIAIGAGAHYLVIAAFIAMSSFGGSLFDPASNAMIADIVEPSKRLEAYGMLRIGQNVGWAAGPMIGGLLGIWLAFSATFFISAVATLVVAVFLYLNINESLDMRKVHERFKLKHLAGMTKDTLFMSFCLVSISLFIMFGQMSSSYAVYSTDSLGVLSSQVALLWTWNGVLVIFAQMPISRWISKYRMSSMIAAGSLMYAIGYGMVGLAPLFGSEPVLFGLNERFYYLMLNMTIVTMGEMFVSPASMNLVANMSPENERGRYMGVFGLVSSIGFALGPFTGGIILDQFISNDILLWAIIGMFGIIAAIGYTLLGKKLGAERDSSVPKA
ncbi:MAG: MFS transporter [Euryarchaeota archaeon]|nr:MFS transporter [Euryarchaeota archaeon]